MLSPCWAAEVVWAIASLFGEVDCDILVVDW